MSKQAISNRRSSIVLRKSFKWADYCLSEIKFNRTKTRIETVVVHLDEGTKISMPPFLLTREALLEMLQAKKTFVEIVWDKEDEIKVKNKVELIGGLIKLGRRTY